LTVNGLTSGYQGLGPKAVIPALASAKFNIRLVPGQEPGRVFQQLQAHLTGIAPPTVRVEVRKQSEAQAVSIDPRHPVLQAAAVACREAFGRPPAFLRSGGTIPIVHLLNREKIPTVLLGLTFPDANTHAPNEWFHLPTYHQGTIATIHFLANLRRARASSPNGIYAGVRLS
jgi:acetylornithine deacetylase/succinyl-diaminopimelate desuccinylase-like protein